MRYAHESAWIRICVYMNTFANFEEGGQRFLVPSCEVKFVWTCLGIVKIAITTYTFL